MKTVTARSDDPGRANLPIAAARFSPRESFVLVRRAPARGHPQAAGDETPSGVTLASIDLAVGVAVTLLNAGFARDVIHSDDRAAPS